MYPLFELKLDISKKEDEELYKEFQKLVSNNNLSLTKSSKIFLVCHNPNLKQGENLLHSPNKDYHILLLDISKNDPLFIYFRSISKKEIKEYLNINKLFNTSIGEYLSR